MSTRTVRAVAATTLLLLSQVTFAQVGNGGATYAGKQASVQSPDAYVAKYVTATTDVIAAESMLLSAVGMQSDAERTKSQIAALTEHATRSLLEKAMGIQNESTEALDKRFAEPVADMDENLKRQFSDGLLELAKGVTEYEELTTDLRERKESFKVPGAQASAAMYITKVLPAYVKNVTNTIKLAAAFAQQKNIQVPREASDLISTH